MMPQQSENTRAIGCNTCPFWVAGADVSPHAVEAGVGDCRKQPPRPGRHHSAGVGGSASMTFSGAWPETQAADFCGEHPALAAQAAVQFEFYLDQLAGGSSA